MKIKSAKGPIFLKEKRREIIKEWINYEWIEDINSK